MQGVVYTWRLQCSGVGGDGSLALALSLFLPPSLLSVSPSGLALSEAARTQLLLLLPHCTTVPTPEPPWLKVGQPSLLPSFAFEQLLSLLHP